MMVLPLLPVMPMTGRVNCRRWVAASCCKAASASFTMTWLAPGRSAADSSTKFRTPRLQSSFMKAPPSRLGPLRAKNREVAGKIRRRLSSSRCSMFSFAPAPEGPAPASGSPGARRPPTASAIYRMLYPIVYFVSPVRPNGIEDAACYADQDHQQGYVHRDHDIEIFDEHLDPDKDQHDGDALLEVAELIHRPAEQEEQGAESQHRKDIRCIDDDPFLGDAEYGRDA